MNCPTEISIVLSVMNTTDTHMQEALEQLKSVLTPDQITFGQAVSVCSVMIEMGLQRATLEDVTDGLVQRFEGLLERSEIQDVADNAITFGLNCGLMESVDSETFSLSSHGLMYGRDWLRQIQQAA